MTVKHISAIKPKQINPSLGNIEHQKTPQPSKIRLNNSTSSAKVLS